MKYIIAAIDDQSPLGVNQFMGHMTGQKLVGSVFPCVGSYNGKQEWSFLMDQRDFLEHALPFCSGQESILKISECNKQYATLAFRDGTEKGIGSLKSVSQEEALKHASWTYRPDLKLFWIAVNGNPDTIPPKDGWLSDGDKELIQEVLQELNRSPFMSAAAVTKRLRDRFFPN
tara:strand:+ start:40738 stop:41256 length:519 start_codon:yes stop_codon:yes gene_type:complete